MFSRFDAAILASCMAIPTAIDMLNETLQAFHEAGGRAHISQIEARVGDILKLSAVARKQAHGKGYRSELGYRLAWTRNYLKRFGLVEKSGQGVWMLTPRGNETKTVNKDDVRRFLRASTGSESADEADVAVVENEDEDPEGDDSLDVPTEEGNPEVEKEDSSSLVSIQHPFDPAQIDISTRTLNLNALLERMRHDEIDLATDFQRQRDLWDAKRQSRLIESILIRLPLPAFYFDGSNDNRWLIVDGLQRLSTLHNFVIKSERGEDSLRLSELEFLTQFENFTFAQLPREMQRRIKEHNITVYTILPGTPALVKFNIFRRINTGGLILEPQEIRHALNQGVPADFVRRLAEMDAFRKATAYSIRTRRMYDRDFTTRFVAFYLSGVDGYQPRPDLDSFLSEKMASLKSLSAEKLNEIETDFLKSMEAAVRIFGNDAFRKRTSLDHTRKPINKSLFEVWSVVLARLTSVEIERLVANKMTLLRRWMEAMNDDDFEASISAATGDPRRVVKRYEVVQNLVQEILVAGPDSQ